MPVPAAIRCHLDRLAAWFDEPEASLTAFSGGVDSALVLFLSHHFLGDSGLGLIADSPSLKRADLALARGFCNRYGIGLRVVRTRELENEAYASNPIDRCFYCKDHLYETMCALRAAYPGHIFLNGTNADDSGDYRPGLEAARQHFIRSPLAECGISKADVRALARHFDLPVWDKPASPCLSSRIPYGERVTRDKLERIEAAEALLHEAGFTHCRVRHFADHAKVEVPADQVAALSAHADLITALRDLGFPSVEIDREGFVSGKLNRVHLPS